MHFSGCFSFSSALISRFRKHNLERFAGPVAGPSEAEFILKRTIGVHGFYGASSMERLPVEQALKRTVQQYKSISFE